uniref:Uncharacterized protein n=1 Tax=Plectus sambesii TaxID=2011161 RepID=A0A914VI22_9BILA
MPGNADGYHAGAVQLWTKGAPEVDAFFSKWDVNGTFSLKKLLLDVIRGLKERGVNIDQQLIDDVSSWSDDPKDFDQSDIEHIAKVLRDLFGRMQELNDDDDDDNLRRSIVNQFSNQVVRKSLPTVRDTAVNASGATTWQTWFWIAAGVAAILAALLLLTCCTACYQRSKQAKNEWLGETSRLNPSSSKMYG